MNSVKKNICLCAVLMTEFLLPPGVLYAGSASAAKTVSVPVDHRVLHFPPPHSFGLLELLPVGNEPALNKLPVPAKGTVSLDVPSGYFVNLTTSVTVLHAPALLQGIVNERIERVTIGPIVELDDSESGESDRLLAGVSCMYNLEFLDGSRTNITDAGLAHLKGMSKLRGLWLYGTSVHGKCFKDLQGLPELCFITLSGSTIDQDSLVYLAKMHKLNTLHVPSTSLGKSGIEHVAKCSQLTSLDIRDNSSIDDQCIASLRSLSKLQDLTLAGTKSSIKGLRSLKGLPLTMLELPVSIGPSFDKEIHSLFPNALIKHPSLLPPTVGKGDKYLFSPLR
jgi:hypothetical protein